MSSYQGPERRRSPANPAEIYKALTAAYECVEVARRAAGEAARAVEAARQDLEQCRLKILELWPAGVPPK